MIREIPSEVLLEPGNDPVPRTSVVNLDSVESVSLATLVERLGRLSDERMHQICEAFEIAVGCDGAKAPRTPKPRIRSGGGELGRDRHLAH
jgi:mRNA interferase MazF